MLIFKLPLILVAIMANLFCAGAQEPQSFEGIVTYNSKEWDKLGKPVTGFIEEEQVIISKGRMLTRTLSGPQLMMIGQIDVYLNAENGLRYGIDHGNKVIRSMGQEPNNRRIEVIEEVRLNDETVNGISCQVNRIKYAYDFHGPYSLVRDTLECTYYSAKELYIERIADFCRLQGNRNTLLFDGRYIGVPLRVEQKRTDGSKIIVESKSIIEQSVDELLEIPAYKFIDP
jgi:hypothetical protein